MRLLDTANDGGFLDIVGPGFFSDLDMLEIGNPEKGTTCRTNFPGQVCGMLTADEQVAHMSLWAALKSPLIIGADPRALSNATLAILISPEVLAVNQDALAKPVRLVSPVPAAAAHHRPAEAEAAHGKATAAVPGTAPCDAGYLVSGAGTPGVDGCYLGQQGNAYRLDGNHSLYAWQGFWHLAHVEKTVFYTSAAQSAAPPESAGGCGAAWKTVGAARAPCPAVKRGSGLPPAPAPRPHPRPSPSPAPTPHGDRVAAGIKLKMAACDTRDPAQQLVQSPSPGERCGAHTANGSCVSIRGKGAHAGLCATVLAYRWPWWVSLLPCNGSDARQAWLATPAGQLIATKAAAADPWPGAKCFAGKCAAAGCLEVEGANPEVDQCGWSTNSSQFVWEQTPGGMLRSAMSGQCLQGTSHAEVYAGPLTGGRFTAVLLNRATVPANVTLEFSAMGLLHAGAKASGAPAARARVRNIVERFDYPGVYTGSFTAVVRPHAVVHVVVTPVAGEQG